MGDGEINSRIIEVKLTGPGRGMREGLKHESLPGLTKWVALMCHILNKVG